MISRFSKVLLACSVLTSAPAFAQAAPSADDIAALRAQILALQAKVDQLSAAQSQQAAQVQQVQAVQAAPPAPVPPLKPEAPGWWGSTTISGKSFFNVSNIDQTSTDLAGNKTDNAQNGTQTELKRFYVSIDHKFNDVFSADITTDFRYNTNGTSKDDLIFVKKAYLQAKLNPALTVRVGAADMPWIPFVEGVYGYRFVENTLSDRTKFGNSVDWGVHALGSFGNGVFNYAVSAVNGAGYKTLTRNSNTIDLEGRISVNPIKPITLAVGGYTGKLSKSNDTVNVEHRATRFNALAAYTDKRVRAGVEYFTAKNWNNITTAPEPTPATATPNDNAHGWSTFGSFAATPQLAVFGRYDWVKPTDVVASGTPRPVKDQYFNVGVDYKPIAPIDLALVWKHDRAKNGFINTSNGSIGGLDHGSYNEIGLFGQFAF
jgi:Phosphate-selective porin O and P